MSYLYRRKWLKEEGIIMQSVNIRKESGKISKIPFTEFIEHEEAIIEDNIFFGFKNEYGSKK